MTSAASTVALVEARQECAGTGVFTFTRPAGYTFSPGQYMTLELDTREGKQTKPFTHADAPGDESSRVLTRMSGSPFKDALLALAPGDPVAMAGPFGRLTVPEGAGKLAFLVGGVGITPAVSIVRDSVLRSTGLECLIFYGNPEESCIPLGAELDAYEHGAPVRRIDVLSRPSVAWTGERGYITAEVVARHCRPLDGWHWFVSGPPSMVDAMRAMLDALAVPTTSTSIEAFAGYA
jgi:ferredoxin-NADP reductase